MATFGAIDVLVYGLPHQIGKRPAALFRQKVKLLAHFGIDAYGDVRSVFGPTGYGRPAHRWVVLCHGALGQVFGYSAGKALTIRKVDVSVSRSTSDSVPEGSISIRPAIASAPANLAHKQAKLRPPWYADFRGIPGSVADPSGFSDLDRTALVDHQQICRMPSTMGHLGKIASKDMSPQVSLPQPSGVDKRLNLVFDDVGLHVGVLALQFHGSLDRGEHFGDASPGLGFDRLGQAGLGN